MGGASSPSQNFLRAVRATTWVGFLPYLFVQQRAQEWALRIRRGIDIRETENARACAAYARMGAGELAGVNALQAWANARTIPRNLWGRLPERAVDAVDLCSGVGDSTAVLARCLPRGSRLLGLEFCEAFVEAARRRAYRDREGGECAVRFRCQSVLTELCDVNGAPIPDASIDVVNSSGAVGCHFDCHATAQLAGECARVIRAGGWALIDSGPDGTSASDVRAIFLRHGFEVAGAARSCALDPLVQICFCRRV